MKSNNLVRVTNISRNYPLAGKDENDSMKIVSLETGAAYDNAPMSGKLVVEI